MEKNHVPSLFTVLPRATPARRRRRRTRRGDKERANDAAAMRAGNELGSSLAVVVGRAAGDHKRRWRRAGGGE
jgi:hypothetical protein